MAKRKLSIKSTTKRVLKTRRNEDNELRLRHQSEIVELRNKIRKARQDYYNNELNKTVKLSDEDYDRLENRLRKLNPGDDLLKQVGALPSKAQRKVSLPFSMPSLDKIKPDETLAKWLARNPGPYDYGDKLDGVSSMLVKTAKNELKLYTRGNGITGVDISHLIPLVRGIGALPKSVTAIRGELCFLRDTFTRKYAKQFKNARNLASGVVNSKDVNNIAKDMIFIVHGVVHPAKSLSSVAGALKSAGFNVVTFGTKSKLTEQFLLSYLAKRREASKVDIDGLVISARKEIVAFKAGYETAQPEVDKIEWNESRFGIFTPVVILRKAVKLAGAMVSRVTAHNARYLVDNAIGPGAIIEITRSGDVIPKIMRTIKPSRVNPLPVGMGKTIDWNASKVDLVSLKKDKSEEAITNLLVTFLIRMGVDKIKDSAVSKLVRYGIDNIPDLIKTEVDEMTDAGLGHAMAAHLHDRLRSQLKIADMSALMAGSSIFGRGFGERVFDSVLHDIPFRQQLILYRTGRADFTERLAIIPGIGSVRAKAYVSSFAKFVKFLRDINWKPVKRTPVIVRKSGLGPSPIVVFTGFRDRDLQRELLSVGGKLAPSVTKNTTHVVALNPQGKSSKLRKADQYGAKILSVQQFKKLLARR